MSILKCIGFLLLFISTAYSQNGWLKLNTPHCSNNIWRIIEGYDGSIFAKCGTNRIFYSSDKGVSWSDMPLTINSRPPNNQELEIFSMASDSLNRFYVGGWNGKIFRTADLGASWDTLKINDDESDLVWDLEIMGKKIYAITGCDFYFSPDFGENWTKQDSIQNERSLEDIAVGPNNILFIADFFDGIHKSVDNGKTWVLSNSGLIYPYCRSVFVYNDSTVLTGTDGAGVWISYTNGQSWSQCSIENSAIHEIYNFGRDKSGNVYAQGAIKVSVTSDLGNSWQSLPSAAGQNTSFLLDSDDHLYLATTEGLFFMDSFVTKIEVAEKTPPLEFAISQNYPNPFNPTTTINYQIPNLSKVKLTIFDVLGREVQTLVNTKQSAGKYQASFDASAFASGVYYYKLVVGPSTSSSKSFEQAKKMLLLK